jgi:Tol biopolymer transport system component
MLASRYREQNADGSDPKRLTDTPNSDTEPAYAPNGTLAIRRTWYQPALGRQITLLDESGNALPVFNPRPEGHKPAWSPDGVWLAYIGAGLFGNETGLVVTLPGHPQGKLIAGYAENPVWIRR